MLSLLQVVQAMLILGIYQLILTYFEYKQCLYLGKRLMFEELFTLVSYYIRLVAWVYVDYI